jgi:hypothetical protein
MAVANQPAPGTGWVINAQTPTVGTANGQVTNGWNIAFTSGRGHEGKLFVPIGQYNEANVRAQITAQATSLDNIGAMTG